MSLEKVPSFLVNFFEAEMNGSETRSYRFKSFLQPKFPYSKRRVSLLDPDHFHTRQGSASFEAVKNVSHRNPRDQFLSP